MSVAFNDEAPPGGKTIEEEALSSALTKGMENAHPARMDLLTKMRTDARRPTTSILGRLCICSAMTRSVSGGIKQRSLPAQHQRIYSVKDFFKIPEGPCYVLSTHACLFSDKRSAVRSFQRRAAFARRDPGGYDAVFPSFYRWPADTCPKAV